MGRTFLRQDAQVRNSVTFSESEAAGSALQTSSTNLEMDLNAVRSQLHRILSSAMDEHWYNDDYTWTTLGGAKKRGIKQLGEHLDLLEERRLLFRAQLLTNITVPAAVAATGSLTAVAKGSLADGDNFTLNDGVHAATVFYFDVTGTYTPPGGVEIDISGTAGANDVATEMRTAINGAANLDITAAGAAATVSLTNDAAGTWGNVAITESVTTSLTPTGMSGGAGDMVLLSAASSEVPTAAAAVDAGTYMGAVVKVLATGVIGRWSSAAITGADALHPKNLVLIRDTTTDDYITSGSKKVYALIQAQFGVVDGDTFDDSTKKVQISFVRESLTLPHVLEHVPAADIAGKSINYSYVLRTRLDDVPESAFLVGAFIDETAAVDVTLDNAVDNQSGPVTQTDRNIDWRITDNFIFRFQDSGGTRNLFAVMPTAGGDEIEINIDTLDINNALDADFLNGATFDSGGTPIRVGVTAGYIDTASADLGVRAGGELYLDDANQTGSTWAQTAGIKLSDSTTEWDNFETAFGEVSLLNAIYQAYQNAAPRSKTVAVVTSNIAANANASGATAPINLDAVLGDYSTKTFVDDVDIYLNGQLLRNGANAGANHDVYPGTDQTTGDLMFEFGLQASPGNPDVITMIIW